MATKYEDDSRAVGPGYSGIEDHDIYAEGLVGTAYGFVDCYSEDDMCRYGFFIGVKPILRLDFIWQGGLYTRTWQKQFTPRGLARKAHAFAREVVQNNPGAIND